MSSFFASGHAGWADAGDDIVCAAVSTILQSAWLGLVEVAKVDVTGSREKSKKTAVLELAWPETSRDDPGVHAIVTTAALAIERIALQYPSHVRTVREPTQS